MLSCLRNPNALAADFEKVIVPVICFLVICYLSCLLAKFMSHVSSTCIYGELADFEQVIVPVLLYLTLFVN